MLFLLTLTLLGAATFGSVALYQRADRQQRLGGRTAKALPPAPTVERTLTTLVPGDVVLDGTDDWLVIGTATYVEEEETWWVHHLEDGGKKRLLDVRAREGIAPSLLEPAFDVPLFGQLLDGLNYRGQPYRLDRRGDARRQAKGTSHGAPGRVQYARYVAQGGAVLIVEDDPAGRRAFAGQRVLPDALTLMPGDGLAPDEPSLEALAAADLEG